MRANLAALATLGLLLAFEPGPAQDHHSTTSSAPLPSTGWPGLGNLHHPIWTKNPEAQLFFDQGLTLVYAFNHEEAIRSFKRAAELDPQAPMPWWGIAEAVGPNYNVDVDRKRENEAYDAVQKARMLASGAPEDERAYIEAMAKRYSNNPHADFKKLAADYRFAMRDLVKRYPDDLDAATLYAGSMMLLNPWKLWTPDGKPGENTLEIVAVLQSVLKRDPQHIGANHFYIHAVEASPHPADALSSAKQLETLAPAAGHLVHMPSHIYERTGDYERAAKANEIGAQVDRTYLAAVGSQGHMYGLMYYCHNLAFLTIAASMEGNFGKSKAAADDLAAYAAPYVKEMAMFEMFTAMPEYVLVRFQRWNGVLSLPAPDSPSRIGLAVWHWARGIAFSSTGETWNAQTERQQLIAAIQKQSPEATYGNNSAQKVFAVALEALDARIAESQGDRQGSISHWRKAVAAQDALSYDEPPGWYYPVRESLGAALAQDGQYVEAEKVFRADLEENPRNPRSLFGLWKTLEAEKKTADAEWIRPQFEKAWKNADVPLRMEDL